MDDWLVWGLPATPLFTGTEQEARTYVELAPNGGELYIQGPQGEEEMYTNGKWVTAT